MRLNVATSDHTRIYTILALTAGLGILFQIGHFVEHTVQFLVWCTGKIDWVVSMFCGRESPFMSAPVAGLVFQIGMFLFPSADILRQTMMGVEILHLIGNSIFLVSIGALYLLVPTKWTRWAFYIEGGHLCEHILLTITAYYIGKPIGLSTLFGNAPGLLGKEYAVGYRVTWHFAMNLLPLPFVMMALKDTWFPKRITV